MRNRGTTLLGGGGFFLQYFSLSKSEKHLQNDFNEDSKCICHWMAIFITQEHIMLNCVFLCTIKNLSWHWCLVITLLSLDTFHGVPPSKQVLFFLTGLIRLTRPGANFCMHISYNAKYSLPSLTRFVDYNAHLLTASRASFCLLDEEEKRRLYLHILLIKVYFRSSV